MDNYVLHIIVCLNHYLFAVTGLMERAISIALLQDGLVQDSVTVSVLGFVFAKVM